MKKFFEFPNKKRKPDDADTGPPQLLFSREIRFVPAKLDLFP
jgi:hypothetical protein